MIQLFKKFATIAIQKAFLGPGCPNYPHLINQKEKDWAVIGSFSFSFLLCARWGLVFPIPFANSFLYKAFSK